MLANEQDKVAWEKCSNNYYLKIWYMFINSLLTRNLKVKTNESLYNNYVNFFIIFKVKYFQKRYNFYFYILLYFGHTFDIETNLIIK